MTERRDPSWVDYGNLAANLVQIGQLSAVQKRLKQLSEIEAAREERILLINELRQIVFESEDGLLRIGEYTARAPIGVFIATSILKAAFNEMGIRPQTFEEFVDKDRVKQVHEMIERRIAEALQQMSVEARSEAQRMLALVPRLSDLESLIKAQDAKDKLAKVNSEYKIVEAQRNQEAKPWNRLLLISLLWGIAGCGLTYLISSLSPESVPLNQLPIIIRLIILLGYLIVMFGVPILGLIIGMAKLSVLPSTQKFPELNKQRASLWGLLLPEEKYKALVREFGDRTNEEYKSLRKNILDYMERVTKKDENGNNLPKSLLSIAFPESILEQVKAN